MMHTGGVEKVRAGIPIRGEPMLTSVIINQCRPSGPLAFVSQIIVLVSALFLGATLVSAQTPVFAPQVEMWGLQEVTLHSAEPRRGRRGKRG